MTVKMTGQRAKGNNDQDEQVWALVADCDCGERLLIEKFENRCGGCGKWYDYTGTEFEKREMKYQYESPIQILEARKAEREERRIWIAEHPEEYAKELKLVPELEAREETRKEENYQAWLGPQKSKEEAKKSPGLSPKINALFAKYINK